ncbi:unnamed protein product [Amoebophrya sp. A120]|nr:unnamed protein product [Amoebophrya sp. A120]|eukprot:GSA120T00006932001.1
MSSCTSTQRVAAYNFPSVDLLGACSTDTSRRDKMKLHLSCEEGGKFLLKTPAHHRKKGRPVFEVHHVAVLHYLALFVFVIMVLFSFTGPSSPGPCGGPHFHGVLVDNLFAAEALRVSASRPEKGQRKWTIKSAPASRSSPAVRSPVLTSRTFTKNRSGGSGGRGKGGTRRSAGGWNYRDMPPDASFAQTEQRVGHGKGVPPIPCQGDWAPPDDDVKDQCEHEYLHGRAVGQVFVVTQYPAAGGAPCVAGHMASRWITCPRDCVGSWNYATEQALIDSCNGQGGEKSRKFTITIPVQHGTWQNGRECNFRDGATRTITCPQDCVGQWEEKPATACNRETGDSVITHEYMSEPAVAGVKEDGTTRIRGQPCRDEQTEELVAAGATKVKECPRDCRGDFVPLEQDGCAGFPVKAGQRVASHEYRITQTALRGGTDCGNDAGDEQTKTCPVDCVQTWVTESNARCATNDGQDVVTARFVVQTHPETGSDNAPGAACWETIPPRTEKCPTNCIGEWRRTSEACEDPGAINWVEQIVSHRYAITRLAEPGYPNNNTPGEKCKDPDCANPIDCQENEEKKEPCPRDCRGAWDYATDALLKEQCTGRGEELTRTFTIQSPKLLTGQECADKGKTATIVCPNGDSSTEEPGAPQNEDERTLGGAALGSSVTSVRKIPNPRELDLDVNKVEPSMLCC